MEMPTRKSGNFLPKMFKVFTIYIVMTLSVFFGYVQIFGDLKPAVISLPTDEAGAEEETYFGSFVQNIMDFKNIDTDFDLTFKNPEMSLSAQGNVVFDNDTKNLGLDLDLIYNEQHFDVKASYISPSFYLVIDDSSYKFDVSSEMDLTGIFEFVSQNLEIDTSFIDNIGAYLGIDLRNLDLVTLQSKLTVEEKQLFEDKENKVVAGYEFMISLGSRLEVRLNCDKEFNITAVKMKDMLVDKNTIKFSANVNDMNDESIEVVYTESGEEIDMTGISEYVGYTDDLFANDYICVDISALVDDESYNGKLFVDNADSLKLKLVTSYEGVDIQLVFVDDVAYIDVNGLKLSFAIEDYQTWGTTINAIVEKYTSKTLAQHINELISGYLGVDPETFDIQQEIVKVLGVAFGNSDKATDFLPNSILEDENSLLMSWANGLEIKLEQTDEQLSTLSASYDNVEIDALFEVVDEGVAVYGQYYDINELLPLTTIIDEVLETKQFAGKLDVIVDGEKIGAEYVVDFESDILALVKCQAFGERVEVYLNDKQVLVKVGETVVEGNLDDVDFYLARIDQIFGTTLSESFGESNQVTLSVMDIIAQVSAVLKELKLTSNDSKLMIVEYLANVAKVAVEEDKACITFENNGLTVEADLSASKQEIILPASTDNATDILAKIENVKGYIEGRVFAFDFALEYGDIQLSGSAQIDVDNEICQILGLELGGNILNAQYKEGVVYIDYAGQKIMANETNLKALVDIVMPILKANGLIEESQEIDYVELLTEIFGEDVSQLSIKDILKMIEINVDGTLNNFDVFASVNTEKEVVANVEATFVENKLTGLEILFDNKLDFNLTVKEFALTEIVAEEYYNLNSAHTGTLTLDYKDVSIDLNIELDLTNRIYARLYGTVVGETVELLILNNNMYVTIGALKLSTDFNNAKELYDHIVSIFDIVVPESEELDIRNILQTIDLNASDVLDVTGLSFTIGNTVELDYVNSNFSIRLVLDDEKNFDDAVIPQNCEDLTGFITKVANVVNYIQAGVYEFDFEAEYNGFDFAGTFKYFDGNFEFVNMVVMGENAMIRLQDNTVYFAYGNMKLKFDVPTFDATDESTSLQEILNIITSETLGVELNFGVFKEIIDILQNYTISDYFTKMVVDILGTTNEIGITLSNKNENAVSQILSQVLNATVSFENNNLDTVGVNIYDILIASLTVRKTEVSTMSTFVADDYKDYSTDFVAGMLDSLNVAEDIYAFASDIAIRYSNNTFYGDLVAMLVHDENYDGVLGQYIPVLSIYTTSLGLNSYIYLIDNDIYIDINGLQITADLTETTIDEVMTFVEQTFGVALAGSVEAFRVILPAIDKVYGSWLSSMIAKGVQINFKDNLWYGETSRFYDIVVQAFIQNYESTIIPTEIVVGANIEDPNTTLYNDYSEFWLKDGEIVMETAVTQNLNFATYLTNVSVGNYVTSLKNVFVGDEINGLKNVVAVKSNYGTTNLADFNSYKTVLDMVDSLYGFVMGLEYQANVSVNIAGADSNTNIGGDVVVKLNELTDEEIANNTFVLFGNKAMKVQGDLDISTNTARHLISLLYESANNAALYATYTHDDYTLDESGVDNTNNNHIQRGNQFNAKINNTSLSDIISMLVTFAKIDLGEDLTNNLGLKPNTTDFEYLQSLLGIGAQDVGDDVSKVDKILSSVESMTAMLNNMKLEKTQMSDGLYQTTFTIKIDMASVNERASAQIGTVQFVLKQENSTDDSGNAVVVTKLRQISVVNLIYGANTINATINLEDYSDSSFDYLTRYPDNVHFDFSSLDDFVDVAVSTINTQNFNFAGSANVAIGSLDLLTVNYDLFASIGDEGELYFYLELDVPSFCDVTYNAGGFGETYTVYSSYGFDNRISILEYKNGVLDITQNTYGNNDVWYAAWKENDNIDAHPEATFKSEEIGPNIMKILAYALGLTDSVYDMIKDLVDTMEPYPSLEETLLSFTTLSNGYQMGVDGQSLTGDDAFNDMDITLGLSGAYLANNRTYKFIDSVDTTLDIGGVLKIPVNLRSVSGTSYKTGYGKTLYTNDYYRKRYLSKFSA